MFLILFFTLGHIKCTNLFFENINNLVTLHEIYFRCVIKYVVEGENEKRIKQGKISKILSKISKSY